MAGSWMRLPVDTIIEVQRLVKQYRGRAGVVTALDGIDLQVGRGEFVAILGKSGAGKTTLVNMISGLDRPTAGELCVAGATLNVLGEDERTVWRGRAAGVVFQFFQLLPSLSVLQNVMLPMDLAGRYPLCEQQERAMQLLEQMGIANHAHKLPAAMSGGQQQRIAIARALANDPPLLVADEPTGSLDSGTAQEVLAVFETLVAQGRTLVMVTHDADMARRATRTIQLADGKIV
jgi:putative ABC transport system ATP-binding protein